MSDQQQILRLLATIREEVAGIRGRQEELYELLISYKDQIYDLKSTVTTGLEGLPKSPYIAGQLVPAPDRTDGVDDFRHLLATFLHRAPPEDAESAPVDTVFEPPAEVKPEEIELEPSDEFPTRRKSSGGGSGSSGRVRRDSDLERGPDRDVVPLDLDEPDDDDKAGAGKKRRRTRRRKKSGAKESDA